MDFDIPENLELTKKFKVEEKHSANFLGSGIVEVLSTPSMILMMEQTAMLAAQDHLPEGWLTVGIVVNIKHLKATRVGEEVKIVAKLKEKDRRKLIFEVAAYHESEVIGKGLHERFIVNREKFQENL